MKRFYINLFLLVLVSSLMVACSKEEVKPYNAASGSAVFEMRDGDDDTNADATSDTDGTVNGDDSTDGGDEEGDGTITDGGNSADYDTKGHKKKKLN